MATARDRPPEEAGEDTSFARGLRVLLAVADRGDVRADELAALLDTPLSTVYRYLRTLTEFGFVDRRGGRYGLGPRLVIGAGSTVSSELLVRATEPVLRLLAEETGETAFVTRRIGLAAVCLNQVESRRQLRVSCEPGAPTALYADAASKALLAWAPDEVVDEVIAQGLDLGALGPADESALRTDLADIGAAGVAMSVADEPSGVVTIAVPILRHDGIVGALAVAGPGGRCGAAWRTRTARQLPDAARTVVAVLEREAAAVGRVSLVLRDA